ncbi:unnamed protein product (macronuclear) [Paramecium tetraurelia]|uniref:1-phosphatidylinositol 4-kinase n=1 Tax=Paramecium tetraurelia TaxID=5888 RepID=A0C8Z5_PARTE|nr:uncharacterized protein GSPATT00006568001 [Paramecium tetraurelia]CAK67262.1 unnamed protein product [Paramecium tetraurelia]|eukprot:XP_001434659.1 hypothetical protein (macronuclear) [Paramecium tetraurelia strain d4-2]
MNNPSRFRQSSNTQSTNYLPAWKQNDSEERKKYQIILLPVNQPREDYIISSIYQMFNTQDIEVNKLIYYYFYKLKESGPHQFLTNKLYQVQQEELEFFIPQLVYILIKNDSPYLEKFITTLCNKSIALYQLIKWCWVSYSDRDRTDKNKMKRLQRIDDQFEQSMLTLNNDHNAVKIPNLQLKSYQSVVDLYLNNLIQMSLILKTYKPEERKPKLKNFITRANVALEKYRLKHQEYYFCQGITVPFTMSKDQNVAVHSNLVVRIIEGECSCFNTKKRVPYRIVVETIDPHELKYKQPKKTANNSITNNRSLANLDDDTMEDFLQADLNQPNKQEIEKKMEELAKNRNKKEYGDLMKITQNKEPKNGMKVFKDMMSAVYLTKKEKTTENEQDQELILKEQIMKNLQIYKQCTNAIEEEKFQKNRQRFNILFPEKTNERTQSCIPKLNSKYRQQGQRKDQNYWLKLYKQNSRNGFRHKHKSIKQLTALGRVRFFKELILFCPKQEEVLKKIYVHLQYDLIEKKLEKNKVDIHQDGIELHSKFGPWDDLWEDRAEMIKRDSPYQHFETYRLKPIIVKGGDDLRQELMTMQIIHKMYQAFQSHGLDMYVKAYEIIVVSASSGILEFCADTISIDGLKKKYPACKSLVHIYKEIFQQDFEEAQMRFIQSLASYSIISYLLQIKDRHNGNILIDSKGRIIHIDFGFILCISPGNLNFEKAPFKLTQEYIDLMNGRNSDLFLYYKNLMYRGFKALQGYVDEIIMIIEVMMQDSDLPCFERFDIKEFRDRFKEEANDEELQKYVDKLIDYSDNNWRTIQYDNFQRMTNGIMP